MAFIRWLTPSGSHLLVKYRMRMTTVVSPSKTPKVVTITVDGLGLFGLVVVAGEVVLVAVVGTVVVVGEVVAWVVLLVVDVLVFVWVVL